MIRNVDAIDAVLEANLRVLRGEDAFRKDGHFDEGPDIVKGVKLKSFDNVDVFSLIAKLLALDTPATDGTLAPLAPALKK